MSGFTPLQLIVLLLAVVAVIVGMVVWSTKTDRRGLVLLVAGLCAIVGMIVARGGL